jgi:hypothetical protein
MRMSDIDAKINRLGRRKRCPVGYRCPEYFDRHEEYNSMRPIGAPEGPVAGDPPSFELAGARLYPMPHLPHRNHLFYKRQIDNFQKQVDDYKDYYPSKIRGGSTLGYGGFASQTQTAMNPLEHHIKRMALKDKVRDLHKDDLAFMYDLIHKERTNQGKPHPPQHPVTLQPNTPNVALVEFMTEDYGLEPQILLNHHTKYIHHYPSGQAQFMAGQGTSGGP